MKKIVTALILGAALILAMTACGGNEAKEVNVSDVYADISAAVQLSEFITLTESDISDYIFADPADFKQMLVKISAEAISADQIVCCEAIDEAAADRLEAAFTAYLDSVKKSFEGYLPAEYEKMKDVQVQRSGNFVYYAVADDLGAIEDVFNKYF